MFTDPNVGALVSNYRDITERKKAEMELRRYAQNNATMTQLSRQVLDQVEPGPGIRIYAPGRTKNDALRCFCDRLTG